MPLNLASTWEVAADHVGDRLAVHCGGVSRSWSELDDHLMLRKLPGIFVAGEMIDWEAPTGGYLIQGCFSTGTLAGKAAAEWLKR